MIAELIGAPPDDWEQFRAWSDAATGTADPEIELDPAVAAGQLYEYFQRLIAARRARPRADLLSVLAEAEIDEHRLTDEDLLNFAFLLLVAGNETTRNLIALGTLADRASRPIPPARRGPPASRLRSRRCCGGTVPWYTWPAPRPPTSKSADSGSAPARWW